jgi:hypothetical protein
VTTEAAREVVAALLAAWFVGSVFHQFRLKWWRRRIARRDVLGLLPCWSFFAPNPGRHDLHVVYRDRDDASNWGPWVELGAQQDPRWWRAVWNPNRYSHKAVSDLVNSIRGGMNANEPVATMLSGAYLAMLNWVMCQPSKVPTTIRQFAVIGRSGHGARRTLELLYVSEEHRVDS